MTETGDRTSDTAEGERAHIIRSAVVAFRGAAFHEVDMAAVARVAELEVADVERWFPTWEHLLGTTITVWNTERLKPILHVAERSGAVAFLRAVVVANQADPALMRLLVAAATIAASPTHAAGDALQHQYLQFHGMVQRALMADVALGREQEGTDPVSGAEQLVALYEGLQLQSMMRPSMHLTDSFDRAVARLRAGWAARTDEVLWAL